MEKKFGSSVSITGEATPNTSGYLEVVLADSGKVLHSKKAGDGYVDTSAKMEKIYKGVEEAIKQQG